MLVYKKIDNDIIFEFIDKGWNKSVQEGVICMVNIKTILVKCMIKCSHLVHGVLFPLDQDEEDDVQVIDIDVYLHNQIQTIISLNKTYNLKKLCDDLINEDEVKLPNNFIFLLD